MKNDWHVIVIGSGPAGLTAALYAARYGLKPLCIEGYQSLGQLQNTTMVENYPGFKDGIMGPDLMVSMRTQAEKFGTTYITKDVTAVDLKADPKVVDVGNDRYFAKSVIISTGATPILLGLAGEQQLMGKGISTCATCDGFFFKGAEIAVVGGGDSAMEETIVLSKYARKIYLIHRRDQFRASKAMQDKVLALDNVEILWNKVVDTYLGEGELSGLRLKDTQNGDTTELTVQGVFIAIGHTPNSSLFKGQLPLTENGYIKIQHPSTRTEIPGVFACGDVQDYVYRQAVTAAGNGCQAAIDANHYLTR